MYATVAEFRGAGSMSPTAQATTTALPDAQVENLITRASRYFDLLCGVPSGYFEPADASPSNRTYYGDGTHFLKLDRYVPGSLNATLTYPSGYTALNFVAQGDPPNQYLVTTGTDGVIASRFTGRSLDGWYLNVPITVSAKWGFAATPEDVKLAVIELAINLWRELDPANVKLVNLEGQPLREKYPPRVWEIARRYRAKSGVLV